MLKLMLRLKVGKHQQQVVEVVTGEEMEEVVMEEEMGEMAKVVEVEMMEKQLPHKRMVVMVVMLLDLFLLPTSSSAVELLRVGCATLSEVGGTFILAC